MLEWGSGDGEKTCNGFWRYLEEGDLKMIGREEGEAIEIVIDCKKVKSGEVV